MNTKYTISLSSRNRRHRVIDCYIKSNTEKDGRGVRVQPLIEQILYECAASELPLMDILWAIRKAGKGGEGIDPLEAGGIGSQPAIDRGEVREHTESRHVAAPSRNDVSEPPEIADMSIETPTDKTAVDGRSSMAKSLAESVVGGIGDSR
jgi:hypothetical protein